jgi:hypothetical protein
MLKHLINAASIAAFVCLVLGFSFAVIQASSQETPKSVSKNQGTATSKYEPGPLTPFRVFASSGLKIVTEYCNSYSEKEVNNWPQKYYCDLRITDVYLALFSGLLVLVTGGVVWTGIRQYLDTRILQRAYISVEPGGVTPFVGDDNRIACNVFIYNAGNLPAHDMSWDIRATYSTDAREEKVFKWNELIRFGKIVLAPKSRFRKGADPTTREEFDKCRIGAEKNKAWLYVWGRITYNDGFRADRWIEFCHRYNLRGTKEYRIPEENGRYHEYGNRTDESR